MLIVLLGGFISWALYVCAFSLVLVREGQNFTTLDLLFIACLIVLEDHGRHVIICAVCYFIHIDIQFSQPFTTLGLRGKGQNK